MIHYKASAAFYVVNQSFTLKDPRPYLKKKSKGELPIFCIDLKQVLLAQTIKKSSQWYTFKYV